MNEIVSASGRSESNAASTPVEVSRAGGPFARLRPGSAIDWCVILVCMAFLISGLAAISNVNLYTPDSTHYLIWAKSLASVGGYRDFTSPETHRYVINAPLYALLLAPAALFFPMNVIAAKIFTLAWGVAVLVLCYRWTARIGGKGAGLTACLLLAANPLFLTYSTEVLSDIPFAALLCGAFILVSPDQPARSPARRLLWLIVLTSAAVLLREVGISLVLAVAIYLGISKRKKEAFLVAAVPILVYLLWLVRNEMIVGAAEAPSVTNSKLFSHHFFTMPDASLLAEFLARAGMNIKGYAAKLGSLLLFPMYGSGDFGMLSPDDSYIAAINNSLSGAKYFLIAGSALGCVFGFVSHWKRERAIYLVALFISLYTGIILLYPINDIRFLLPPLLLLSVYAAVGWRVLLSGLLNKLESHRAMTRTGIACLMIVILTPNIVWIARSIDSTVRYKDLERGGFNDVRASASLPRRYQMPLELAGAWLESRTAPSSVVLTRFIDLAPFLKDRKIQIIGDRASVEGMEISIRDYGIQYVVTVDDGRGLWTFEPQMRECARYRFSLVHRIGDIGIFLVRPSDSARAPVEGCDETPARRGLSLLTEGRYAEAEQFLSPVIRPGYFGLSGLFLYALAEEYSMKLQQADALFARFGDFGQAEDYIDEASVHRQLIGILQGAANEIDPRRASWEYFTAAAGYWDLGSRQHARRLLDRAIALDSTNIPAFVLGFHFALTFRDTTAAELYVRETVRREPAYALNSSLVRIVSLLDSLKSETSASKCAEIHVQLAGSFDALTMRDDAVDNLLLSTQEKPEDSSAWMLLASHYRGSARYSLAARALQRVLSLDPGNAAAKEALSQIESLL